MCPIIGLALWLLLAITRQPQSLPDDFISQPVRRVKTWWDQPPD